MDDYPSCLNCPMCRSIRGALGKNPVDRLVKLPADANSILARALAEHFEHPSKTKGKIAGDDEGPSGFRGKYTSFR